RFVAVLFAVAATVALAVAYVALHRPAFDSNTLAVDRGPLRATEFVLWPGAAELPVFESGQLMRVQMPVSVAAELGLMPTQSPDGIARADILVGQDGLPRAVR